MSVEIKRKQPVVEPIQSIHVQRDGYKDIYLCPNGSTPPVLTLRVGFHDLGLGNLSLPDAKQLFTAGLELIEQMEQST